MQITGHEIVGETAGVRAVHTNPSYDYFYESDQIHDLYTDPDSKKAGEATHKEIAEDFLNKAHYHKV